MKVENKSIFMGDDTLKSRHAEGNNKDKTQSTKALSGVAFKEKLDPIAQKKKKAMQQAMKIIGDAFAKETKLDDELNERRQKVKDLKGEIGDFNKEIRSIESEREALRETYGVAEGSEEEKDLQLLAREAEKDFKGKKVSFTEEEEKRLSEIHKKGLTEYQERSLEMKKSEKYYSDAVYDDEMELRTENAIIIQTKLERLKYHPMLDAREKADEVLDAASDEILGMLIAEGKEHVDEELEEKIEAAKEKKEEKEEFEERIEKAKEKEEDEKKLTEEILEDVADLQAGNMDLSNAQEQVKEMLSNLKILEEDIKGAAVDKEV